MSYVMRLHTSYACNNKCNYCHVFVNWKVKDKPKFMSIEIADKALRTMSRVLKRSNYRPQPIISLYGGEPLTNRKLINHIMNTKYEVNFGWILNTNGTLVTEELADLLKRNNVDVHLSLDGPEERHNYNRITKQGNPAFPKALKGLEILSQKGCTLQLEPCLVDDVPIYEIVDMAKRYKCRSIYLAFADGFLKNVDVLSLAEKVADGLRYAHSNGILLSGPWFIAIYGRPYRTIPNVIVDTDGKVYDFTMTMELCDLDSLEDFYFSESYYRMHVEHNGMRVACSRFCPIYGTCGGYLKSMVLYHTKSLDGYYKECSIAIAIRNELNNRKEYYGTLRIPVNTNVSRFGNVVFLTKKDKTYIIKDDEVRKDFVGYYSDPKVKSEMLRSGVLVFGYPQKGMVNDIARLIKGKVLLDSSNYSIVSNKRLKLSRSSIIDKCIYKILRHLDYVNLGDYKVIFCVTEDISKFWKLSAKMPDWVSSFVSDSIVFCNEKGFYSLMDNEKGLVHELCHSILGLKYVKLPWWLNEGLCDYIAQFYDLSEVNRLYDITDVVKYKSVLDADSSIRSINRAYMTLQSFVEFLFYHFGKEVIPMIRNSSDFDQLPSSLREEWISYLKDRYGEIQIIPLKRGIERGSLLSSLRLNITRMCNMRCSYCFSIHDKVKLNDDIVIKSVDYFMDTLRMNSKKRGMIRFFGGEPLLFFDLVKLSIDKANELASKYRIKLSYILNTNGTIISDDIVKVVRENNVSLSISLDGIGPVHDSKRKMVSGKGSFDIIDRNIDKFLESGCRVSLDCTVSSHNYDKLDEIVIYAKEKSDKHHPNVIRSIGFNDVYVVKDNISRESIADSVVKAYRLGKELGVKVGGVAFFPYDRFIRMCEGKLNSFNFCMGCGKEVCVDYDGTLYSCGVSNFVLGSLDEWFDTFSKREYLDLVNRSAGSIPECRGCEIEFLCCGGCVADSYRNTGSLYKKPSNCDFNKAVFNRMVRNER